MVGDERGVGVLTALDQGRAADTGDGVLAVEFQEQLVAHHGAASGESKSVKARPRANRGRERRDMQRVGSFGDDLDVIDMSLIADENLKRRVDLIIAASGTFMTFDQHGAGALLYHHQRAHEGRGRLCRSDEEQINRPLDGRAGGDADHGAVAHQARY